MVRPLLQHARFLPFLGGDVLVVFFPRNFFRETEWRVPRWRRQLTACTLQREKMETSAYRSERALVSGRTSILAGLPIGWIGRAVLKDSAVLCPLFLTPHTPRPTPKHPNAQHSILQTVDARPTAKPLNPET